MAIARGAPIVAAELGEHALRATPAERAEDGHRRALATARAHLPPERELVLGQSRSSSLAAHRRGRRAPRRSCSWPSWRERNARSRSSKRRSSMRQGTCTRGVAALAAGYLGRLTKGMAWAQRHARVAVELADELDDDALRAGALSALAFLRFNSGEADAPREAERAHELAVASGDRQPAPTGRLHTLPRPRLVRRHRACA